MSTKASIAHHAPTADEPSVHVYEDALDWLRDAEPDAEPMVYVEFQGPISVAFETLTDGRATLTIGLPRKTAVAIGLIPAAKAKP
jgi:hypothetical protein